MGEEAVSHYIALLNGHAWLRESMSVTWAHGLGEEAVFRAFGADPATAQVMTGLEVESALMDTPRDRGWPKFLRVGRATEAWAFGVEAFGFQGSRPEVIRPLSRYGRALSVFWNVNAANQFMYAENGRTMTWFEMSDPDDRGGGDPSALEDEIAGLPFGRDGDYQAAGLALAERITGWRLRFEALAAALPAAQLKPVPEDLIPEALVDDPVLAGPFLADLIADPRAGALPAIAYRMAEMIAEDAGIMGDQAVREALSCLATSAPVPDTVRERLLARYRDHADVAAKIWETGERRAAAFVAMSAIGGFAAQLGRDPDPARRSRMGNDTYVPRRPDYATEFFMLKRIQRHIRSIR
ncbi:hypothetical protein Ait01nite_013860 [Actinoplanes italicus]|uniref:Uncharacterized protein n=1 Tax=Actinoplanes italicus TaxID=113567 RepID=A0A2T0KHA3_9ACTN|nr:DUF6461 domain-containing protein [Actinoplanes italicus]PRX22819.1 hypothetical protein CLV67_104347 [Actinoplanes italicus]GIE28341.1 hypothetical protein Ait01nite_013860 [Actinoplanes italicus]